MHGNARHHRRSNFRNDHVIIPTTIVVTVRCSSLGKENNFDAQVCQVSEIEYPLLHHCRYVAELPTCHRAPIASSSTTLAGPCNNFLGEQLLQLCHCVKDHSLVGPGMLLEKVVRILQVIE